MRDLFGFVAVVGNHPQTVAAVEEEEAVLVVDDQVVDGVAARVDETGDFGGLVCLGDDLDDLAHFEAQQHAVRVGRTEALHDDWVTQAYVRCAGL